MTLAYRVEVEDVSPLRISPESLELRFFAREDLPPEDLVAVHRPIVDRYLTLLCTSAEEGPREQLRPPFLG